MHSSLREAAYRLERLAARTTAGDWRLGGLLASRPEVIAHRPDGGTEHIAEARAQTGAWITALSPAVAAPLAAWLRSAAEGAPDPAALALADVLLDRLVASRADPRDPDTAVVVAAAGSSDARSVAAVEGTADLLQRQWAGPVTTGYGSAAQPTVPDAIAQARRAGAERVVVASYLLAPGHFHDKLQAAGADAVTAPLLPDDRIAAVLLDRYDAVTSTDATSTTARGSYSP